MSDEPSYEEMEALGANMLNTFDQYAALSRSMMKALATYEQACRNAGMSEPFAAAFTMKMAEGLGWPIIPTKMP